MNVRGLEVQRPRLIVSYKKMTFGSGLGLLNMTVGNYIHLLPFYTMEFIDLHCHITPSMFKKRTISRIPHVHKFFMTMAAGLFEMQIVIPVNMCVSSTSDSGHRRTSASARAGEHAENALPSPGFGQKAEQACDVCPGPLRIILPVPRDSPVLLLS